MWNVTKQEYEESDVPLPDGTLPDITADTSEKYLSNDGKKAYWAEVQAGGENKIDAIEVNGVKQPIVNKTVNITTPTKTSDLSNDSGYITNEALDGYATKAELPTKVSQIENDSKYITASDAPVQSVNGKTGAVVLDTESIGAQNKITGAATTITDSNLTANCALVSDANGKVAVSHVTTTELACLDGVTSNVQTQLNSKQGVNDEIQGERIRGGLNSIGSIIESVAINPSVNGAGFARKSGAIVKIYYGEYEMPMSDWDIDALFDGKFGTYLNFPQPDGNFAWENSKTYPVGAYVTNGGYWYKALRENLNVAPTGDTTGVWELASHSQAGGYINLDNVPISIDITFPFSIRYENSLSLYWRANNQNAPYIKVEKYDSNLEWFQVYENSSFDSGDIVNNIWLSKDPSGAGTQKRMRITFKARIGVKWCALTQIAITGVVGGIEGTLVNRGGSTMYGNLSPYTSGGASLGTGSARWNEVHANKIYGDGSNLTNLPIAGLPAVTTADNGKTLRVVNGVWTVAL